MTVTSFPLTNQIYHSGCPWLSAQKHLQAMSLFKVSPPLEVKSCTSHYSLDWKSRHEVQAQVLPHEVSTNWCGHWKLDCHYCLSPAICKQTHKTCHYKCFVWQSWANCVSSYPSVHCLLKPLNYLQSPRGKVHCVAESCRVLISLLQYAKVGSPPGADDLFPVLVYVLIKANPPRLLSTTQYVKNFLEDELSGEENYWWVQFSTAVEFTKTLE